MQIKRIADLVEWHKELSAEFDKALPSCYRFNGETDTGDRRRDAWANADKLIVQTGAALTELEAVLRSHAIQRSKPRGKPKAVVATTIVNHGDGRFTADTAPS